MRILLSFLFCCAVIGSIQAQIDLKVNVGSLIFGGYGLNGEFGLNENNSVSLGAVYAFNDFGSDTFKYKNFRVIPEYRYYFSPRQGVDRFFVGAYGKVAFLTAENDGREQESATRIALGIMAGHKWVTDGGFVFELNAGVGRGSLVGADSEVEEIYNAFANIDARLGIIVGYRLGQGR